MRIRAESKVITLGDLKVAVAAFESQGFTDTDVLCPDQKYLPAESEVVRNQMGSLLSKVMKDAGEGMARKTGIVLWMEKNIRMGNDANPRAGIVRVGKEGEQCG